MFKTAKTLIEEKERNRKSTSDKEEILPSEVNLLLLPFFSLSKEDASKKEGLEYKKSVTRDGKTEEVVWKVTPSEEYGYPGTYD